MSGNEDILVRFGADVGPLKKGANDAKMSISGVGAAASDAAKKVAGLGVAAAAAAAAGVMAIVKNAAEASREIKNLSNLLGVSAESFQRQAAAARSVGVEQDKLADIYKDVGDKVGDFLQNNAGPMVDYFTNIAPKVGQTADQFKYLSGPQALQKYMDGLQAANLSQSEMTFYMENIASDATLLAPLLADGGKEFERLGDRAELAGAVLSSIDIEKLQQFKVSMVASKEAATGFTNQLAVQFAPVLTEVMNRFAGVKGSASGLGVTASDVFGYMVTSVGFVGDALNGLYVVFKGLEIAADSLGVVIFATLEAISASVDWVVNSAKSTINGLIEGMNNLPGVDLELFKQTESGATSALRNMREVAVAEVAETAAEIQNLLMAPMPSSKIKAFVASVTEAATLAAEATAIAIPKVAGSATKPEDDGSVQANKLALKMQADDYQQYANMRKKAAAAAGKDEVKTQKLFSSETLNAASSGFGELSTLMNSENRKQFEIGKTAAKAQTIVDTYASASGAYKSLSGIPLIGPALGAAAAGAAIASGMGRLSAINSTSFGSGSISGGGSSSASSAATSPGQQASGMSQTQSLYVEGVEPGLMFSTDQVRSLIDKINEAHADGKQVVLA